LSTISNVVGKKIREVRNDLGLSMEACAEKAGISTTFLGDRAGQERTLAWHPSKAFCGTGNVNVRHRF